MSDSSTVSWRWVVGVLVTIVMLGGGAWAATIQAQVTDANKNAASQAADIAVIKEKLRVIEEGMKDERERNERRSIETNQKLDQLLLEQRKKP